MEDPRKRLTDEFGSFLDETTIISISSDYNLDDPEEFAAARQVLLTISKDVVAEEESGFNPSGLGLDGVVDINSSNQGDEAEAAAGTTGSDARSVGGFTATTESSAPPSLESSGPSKTSSHESPGLLHIDIFDSLSDAEKEHQLAEMFVSLKPIDVKLALQKSKGDASLAMDELLNLQWLEQTGQRPKGVDGFYVSDDDSVISQKKKKGKRKKKVKVATPKATTSAKTSEDASTDGSVQTDHITLISDRLKLSPSEVTSIYHRNNASPGATVIEILNNFIVISLSPSDPDLQSDIEEETAKFPWVPRDFIQATLQICPARDDATGIIRILADHFEKPSYLKYDVSYSVVASDSELVAAESGLIDVSMSRQLPKSSPNMQTAAVGSPLRTLNQPTNLQAAAAVSRTLAESRNHSFTSAAAAFKKGRSDPLFRQAGAYYAQRAHEQAMSFRQASSVEANYLVDQKSTKDMIDLHGVTVQDGVSIALDRVWKWWQSLGEERARKAKQGFTVVTGIGRHSADGRSPLRINVFKALVADGWKVEVLTGSYLVTGRR
ncbi:hypothetical protein F5Y13DRAFT_119677 [Hypoxylon sp. FL1857]|nr:hypothetical protein F5Y13DRAFT_119677 [Hypoxylon sp. FL1857]